MKADLTGTELPRGGKLDQVQRLAESIVLRSKLAEIANAIDAAQIAERADSHVGMCFRLRLAQKLIATIIPEKSALLYDLLKLKDGTIRELSEALGRARK